MSREYAGLPTTAAVSPYETAINQAASKYGVPVPIIVSVIQQESEFNPNTPNSSAGAMGIAQFMPQAAKAYNIDPHDPFQAIDASAHYLKDLNTQYGDWTSAVKHYNGSGPQADAYASEVIARAQKLGYDPATQTAPPGTSWWDWLKKGGEIITAPIIGPTIGGGIPGDGSGNVSGALAQKLDELWQWMKPHLFAVLGFVAGLILFVYTVIGTIKSKPQVIA